MSDFNRPDNRGGSGPVKAVVKWFNPTKGFGFVTLDNGTDAFCHASALAALGSPSLPQGATVMCDVAQGQRGMQVTTVHNIDTSTADPNAGSHGGGGHGGGFGRDRGPRQSRGGYGGDGGGY